MDKNNNNSYNQNPNGLSKEKIARAYVMYAKYANKSARQIKRIYIFKTAGIFAMLITNILLIIAIFNNGKNLLQIMIWIIASFVVGIALGWFLYGVLCKKFKKAGRIERNEGYTQNLIDEYLKIAENEKDSLNKCTFGVIATIATVHNLRGEFSKADEYLSRINFAGYASNPNGAHFSYAALLTQRLLSGDMQGAEKAYNDGFYFLRTYMNSPASGIDISTALAAYEYFKGHYSLSIQLLDNAYKILYYEKWLPKDRLPNEMALTRIYYMKALNLACMGNKAAAWELLNKCGGLYKTDYYQCCIDKLLDDMTEKNETEVKTANETIS